MSTGLRARQVMSDKTHFDLKTDKTAQLHGFGLRVCKTQVFCFSIGLIIMPSGIQPEPAISFNMKVHRSSCEPRVKCKTPWIHMASSLIPFHKPA